MQRHLLLYVIIKIIMKNILIIITSFLVWIFLLTPNTVFADSEFIRSFDSKITAHRDGSFDVTEMIQYDFGGNTRHGIYRYIPTLTSVGQLYRETKIDFTAVEKDGQNENFTVTSGDNQVSAKIGNPNRTINGVHTYTISYNVKNGIGSNYEDHDEIYWNVTGNQWQVPILSASASIATDFGVLPNQAICFTGQQGSKDQNCKYPTAAPFNPITTTLPLSPYQGLTVVAGFPVNTFPKSILSKSIPGEASESTISDSDLSGIKTIYLVLAASTNFILAPGLLIWYLKYKRKKHFGPVSVNFDLPKDPVTHQRITPAEAGIIDNTKLEKDDVVATIFDLAIRKYIKIEQVQKKRTLGIFGGGEDYNLVKLEDYSDLEEFEKVLLDRLFQDGDSIEISSLKTDFYETFGKLGKEVFSSLVAKKYYTKNPANQRGLLIFAAIISFFFLGLFLSGVLLFLANKLNGRTAKGDEMDFKIDGLKLFLKNMSREYKWQAKNLYIVEKYIPYAIALGYIDEFMEQLKIIYPNYKPNWYTGNMAFYAISNNMVSSMNSGFTSVAPHSSSGFSSGGGFSGGGGGGGGGGSW